MCQFMSFFHKPDADGKPEIKVWDLGSHGKTEQYLNLNKNIWGEGHYTPSGSIELRHLDSFRGDKTEYETVFRNRLPAWQSFLSWAIEQGAVVCSDNIDLSGCDLKGVTLPSKIGGSLDLRGCDLKGVKLPEKIGGSLDLGGCDLNGVTLPEKIGGSLDLRGCDLEGVKLPERCSIIK